MHAIYTGRLSFSVWHICRRSLAVIPSTHAHNTIQTGSCDLTLFRKVAACAADSACCLHKDRHALAGESSFAVSRQGKSAEQGTCRINARLDRSRLMAPPMDPALLAWKLLLCTVNCVQVQACIQQQICQTQELAHEAGQRMQCDFGRPQNV